jgi:hypothetical protein
MCVFLLRDEFEPCMSGLDLLGHLRELEADHRMLKENKRSKGTGETEVRMAGRN